MSKQISEQKGNLVSNVTQNKTSINSTAEFQDEIINIVDNYVKSAFDNVLNIMEADEKFNTNFDSDYLASIKTLLLEIIKPYFLKSFLIEAVLLYDGAVFSKLAFEYTSKEDLSTLLKDYNLNYVPSTRAEAQINTGLEDLTENYYEWATLLLDKYCNLLEADEKNYNKTLSKPTSFWRGTRKLSDLFFEVEKHSFEEYKEHHYLTASSLYSSIDCEKDITFDIYEYASDNFVFLSLLSDCVSIQTYVPMSFAAYIGFISHNLTDHLNLFHHCETYKKRHYLKKNHNNTRDFKNVSKTYLHYSCVVETLLENIIDEENTLHTQYVCNEFLLSSCLLHRQFFSSTNSELFKYLAKKISPAIKVLSSNRSELYFENSDEYTFYYSLLKYLHYFDIDLNLLEKTIKLPSDIYDTTSNVKEMDNTLVLLFCCLHEIFAYRGKPLNDMISFFNVKATDNLLNSKKQLNRLADKLISDYTSYYFDTDKSNINLIELIHRDNYPLASYLVHLSAFQSVVI